MRASVKPQLGSGWRDSSAVFLFTTGGQSDNEKVHLVSPCIAPIRPVPPIYPTELKVLRNAQKCSEMLRNAQKCSEMLK